MFHLVLNRTLWQCSRASACQQNCRAALANASPQAPLPAPSPLSLHFRQALMGIRMQGVQKAPSETTALYLPLQATYGVFTQ